MNILIQIESCQPIEADNTFTASNIRSCERYVRYMQRRLDKAVANDDKAKIRWYFHILSKKSQAVKILAVNRVTRINQGKKTAGVDKVKLPDERDKQIIFRHQLLNSIDVEINPKPIRRVFIPKANGKKRPLGIPTMSDRVVQDILRQSLEPITEYHFNKCSYGFRPKRCTHDAQQNLFVRLSGIMGKRWVIEGDIKGCFDNIRHESIIKTLSDWDTPEWTREVITKMLKSKIFYEGEGFPTNKGTPQGGILSPMLANVALTSMDNFSQERFGWRSYTKETGYYQVNPMVRYADDFIIICKSELDAKLQKEVLTKYLKESLGLELSDEKTKITHLTKGFDFLGFNIRKYEENHKFYGKKPKKESQLTLLPNTAKHRWENHKLLIKPDKERVKRFLKNCKEEIKKNKTAPQGRIIKILNDKLRGWGNYYRFVVSSETFIRVDYEIWWKLYFWAKRRHPDKTKSWVIKRYFSRIGTWKQRFQDRDSKETLILTSQIPTSTRWTLIRSDIRVHESSPEAIEYWQNREFKNAKNSIFGSKVLTQLFHKQKGKCPYCKMGITDVDIKEVNVHKHHMQPRSQGGNYKLSNLRLVHADCHREIHAKFSRLDMAKYTKSGIDYLRLYKP